MRELLVEVEERTEEIVGRWLAKDPGCRQKIVLATKVYNIMGEGQNDRGLFTARRRRYFDHRRESRDRACANVGLWYRLD